MKKKTYEFSILSYSLFKMEICERFYQHSPLDSIEDESMPRYSFWIVTETLLLIFSNFTRFTILFESVKQINL